MRKKKCTCKIEIQNENNNNFITIIGTGFFCEINYSKIPIKKALFTNNHIINEKNIKKGKDITFQYFNENLQIEKKTIKILENRRTITDKKLDFTCIEILDEDNIKNYFNIDETIFNKDKTSFKNKDVLILHYPNGKDLSFSDGKIMSITQNELKHSASTCHGSSGSPIILRNNKIIGIHYGGYYNSNNINNNENSVDFNLASTFDAILIHIKYQFCYNQLEKNILTLNKHTNRVNNIIILKDGRLSSCSWDGYIYIYKIENYEIDEIINVSTGINYHIELLNTNIIACCNDKTLKIYKTNNNRYQISQILSGHLNIITKVIELNTQIIISCSSDKTMKVWKKNKNKNKESYYLLKTVLINQIDKESIYTNLLKINNIKIVTSEYEINEIKFWDTKNNYNNIKTIKNIECNWCCNSMCMINDNTLLIGSHYKGIYLIDINKYDYIFKLYDVVYEVYSVTKLLNGNILIGCKFCGENEWYIYQSIRQYKFKSENKLIKVNSIKVPHNKKDKEFGLYGLIEMKDGTIISCSSDKDIKFWE